MTESISNFPRMLTGEELDEALKVLPEYDASIRKKSTAERLIALQDIYKVFVPNKMSREIYSKLYLALLRSYQKKQSILAVKQSNENCKYIRKKTYDSIMPI